jgi:hypothetical protein
MVEIILLGKDIFCELAASVMPALVSVVSK